MHVIIWTRTLYQCSYPCFEQHLPMMVSTFTLGMMANCTFWPSCCELRPRQPATFSGSCCSLKMLPSWATLRMAYTQCLIGRVSHACRELTLPWPPASENRGYETCRASLLLDKPIDTECTGTVGLWGQWMVPEMGTVDVQRHIAVRTDSHHLQYMSCTDIHHLQYISCTVGHHLCYMPCTESQHLQYMSCTDSHYLQYMSCTDSHQLQYLYMSCTVSPVTGPSRP